MVNTLQGDVILNLKITIPSDDGGYIGLKCPICGEHFKVSASDLKADYVLYIWCPGCGLSSESYHEDDVARLALAKASNFVQDQIADMLDNLFSGNSKSGIEFSVDKKPEREYEKKITTTEDRTILNGCKDCGGIFKIDSLLSTTAHYCPLCGGLQDGE